MGSRGHSSFRMTLGGLVGVSMPLQRLFSLIPRASSHRYPLLIHGESGTGKELVARTIHFAGRSTAHAAGARTDRPFMSFDCRALGPTLMEPELFGYAKDAFIRATQAKDGVLRLAESGTIFLNDIEELPRKLQAKLFQVLQHKTFSPIGSTERFPFRARVIAGSQRDLGQLVGRGAFREDLYFRLSAVRIELPPLRERRGDIPLLASHFLEKYSEPDKPTRNISDAAMQSLLAYSWPKNVLELEQAMRWALSLASSTTIEMDDLPPVVRGAVSSKLRLSAGGRSTLQPEYLAIIQALDATGGDRSAAAHLLRIDRAALDDKLQSYGL